MKTLLLVKDENIAVSKRLFKKNCFDFGTDICIYRHYESSMPNIIFTSPYYNVHIVKFLRNPKVENNNIYILIKRNST